MTRLSPTDVACWVLKSTRLPGEVVAGWRAGQERRLARCVRRSYRLELIRPGRPCLLWVSGRTAPGVHAIGVVAGEVSEEAGGPEVAVDLTLLAQPVPRGELLADPVAAVRAHLALPPGSGQRLGPWRA